MRQPVLTRPYRTMRRGPKRPFHAQSECQAFTVDGGLLAAAVCTRCCAESTVRENASGPLLEADPAKSSGSRPRTSTAAIGGLLFAPHRRDLDSGHLVMAMLAGPDKC